MLRQSGRLLDGTEGISVVRRERVHRALIARSHIGYDHTRLPLEALSAAIDEEASCSFLALSWVVDLVNHAVDPSTCLHIVEASNYNLELAEKFLVELLYRVRVRCDLAALDTVHDEFRSDVRLVGADIFFAEKELTIQVGHVDHIQVDYVNVLDARESQVLEDLTAETTSTDDKNACLIILQTFDELPACTRFEVRTEGAGFVKDAM